MKKAVLDDEAALVYSLARIDLALYVATVHRTDDGKAAMPPKHLLDQVIPVLEDDRYGDTVIIAPPGSVKTNTMLGYLGQVLGNHPDWHTGYVCATGPESVKRSLALRDLIELSPEYKAIFPETTPDKYRGWSQDNWYLSRTNKMDKNPSFVGVGVGGAIKGARLHRVVYDDVSDDENTKTELQRKAVWRFLGETGKTRMHPKLGRSIMIGTREHEEDAIGYALDRGWHTVHIPALDEEGKSYWEDYFPTKYLACPNDDHNPTGQCCMKKELGTLGFARQFMGVVYNAETTRFAPGNWRRYDVAPDTWDSGCITIDTAGWDNKSDTSDYAVLAAWVKRDHDYYCLKVQRGRWLFSDVERQAIEMQAEFGLKLVVEDVPWAKPLIDRLKTATWGVIPWPVKGKSKLNRADAMVADHEAGMFWLPKKAPWVQTFIDEHAAFPDSKHDDQVDTSSMAYLYLNKKRGKVESAVKGLPFRRDWGRLSA